MLRVSSAARTHVGHVRRINEDRLLDRAERGIWAVADGMGGHGGGDVAASLAVAALDTLATGGRPIAGDDMLAAIQSGNAAILEENARSGGASGATIVALHLNGASAEIFWAGDSRAYRLRRGRAEQLTRDHSVVQELVDAGLLGADEAETHPRAHVVTRALGVAEQAEIERRVFDAAPGDIFLLCSDGFSRALALDVLAAEIAAHGADVGTMLHRAVARDGSDNVSFIVIRIG